ncbi:MAG: hypothetical protein VYA84_14165 [Planctomycetota bacterium]|nr:hypothetical protein [Planctomycetota bacterium]
MAAHQELFSICHQHASLLGRAGYPGVLGAKLPLVIESLRGTSGVGFCSLIGENTAPPVSLLALINILELVGGTGEQAANRARIKDSPKHRQV